MMKTLDALAQHMAERGVRPPKVGLVLGSGLGAFAQQVDNPVHVYYRDLPGFPASTVPGHAGRFVSGSVHGVPVLCMQGRFHPYEGHSLRDVVLPIRLIRRMGAGALIVTNATGGVNKAFVPGDLMLITDHINLTGANPLCGPNEDELGPRFPDMTHAYDRELQDTARTAALQLRIALREGVYCMMSGPSFETPAEIRMIRTLGGDAVGMSTVPEVVAARHCGLRVLGISCITNAAAGILDAPLSHEEVMRAGDKAGAAFAALLSRIVQTAKL